MFDAYPAFPLRVHLTALTTREVLNETLARCNPESRYLLIDRNGMFREEGYRFMHWGNAVKFATAEALIIYNARSKKASRPVWHQPQYLQRKLAERSFEQVLLIPYLPAVQSRDMRRVRQIFHLGEENAQG